MSIKITEYINVRERLEELGCDMAEGFILLPVNFENAESAKDFKQVAEAATVKTLLRSAKLPYSDILPFSERPAYVLNNSWEWVAPTLLITAAHLSQHPDSVATALELITQYVNSIFPRKGKEKNVKLEIVVETNNHGTYRSISYEGSPDGVKDIAKIVKAAKDE